MPPALAAIAEAFDHKYSLLGQLFTLHEGMSIDG
jgi:hypothetical protein